MNKKVSCDLRSTANNYKEKILRYENILIAHTFVYLFSITGPLSRYLQTACMDLLKCTSMVQNATKQLPAHQRDADFIIQKASGSISWGQNELISRNLEVEIKKSFPEKKDTKNKEVL